MKRTDDETILYRKAIDAIALTEKYASVRALGFLDPKEQTFLKRELPSVSEVMTVFSGGYDDAERRMLICSPIWKTDPKAPITILKIAGRFLEKLTHRDYLGAVLALGLKREKIGDILVGDVTYMFVWDDIADYICEHLTKIGAVGVCVTPVEYSEIKLPTPKFISVTGSVASLRLDAVLAMGLKESRTAAQRLIENERVSVNYQVTTNPSQTLSEGDKISIRGFGKMIFDNSGGLSKKGRRFVTLKRYV